MRNRHEDMNRWGMPGSGQSIAASSTPSSLSSSSSSTTSASSGPTTDKHSKSESGGSIKADLPSNSPTDSENNNQPIGRKLSESPQFLQPTPNDKSLGGLSNSTISAAADSSDNQPPTPQPTGAPSVLGGISGGGPVEAVYNNSPLAYQTIGGQPILAQDMHHYPTYMHGYEQYYHPPPPNVDYAAQSALYASQQVPPGNQEYKIVPSTRYHPYMNNSGSLHPQHSTNGSVSNNASSTASNSSLSPRVVSSSSPTQNAIIGQAGQDSMAAMQQQSEQAGGPKVCDKCGAVCQTHVHLTDHYNTAHGTQPPNDRSADEQQSLQSQYPYQPYIKEEPSSDILDLDSQKMVYPPQHDGSTIVGQEPLPPMHSMHPMHRSLVWGAAADIHSGYLPHGQPPDMKPYYSPLKQSYAPVKQEYPGTIVPGFNAAQSIKSEYAGHNHQTAAVQSRDLKPFNTDINAGGGNPVTTSPSEFPSTTTPQENGGQYRGFEPPTSSLPSNTSNTKSSNWKSNEARRPKTYNCTACNKWFTSSGHLKRHYNTTLHKNAVKSSGQPDPATLPISAHHHPSRDPNSKHHHHRNSQGNQPPPVPPEPPRSPEYTPQYTPPPNSYNQPQQGFQQYANLQQSSQSTNGHPNGQAGPSVRASLQQRGLLIISNTAITSNLEAQQEQEQQMHRLQHQQLQPEAAQDPYTNLQHQAQQQAEQEELQQQAINTSRLELHQERQQPSQAVHIISMSPQVQQHMLQQQLQQEPIISTMDTTPTTTTTIINTMDQEYIITSPLAINTNITQSFQPLPHPGEPQLNYPTITGNDVSDEQMISASDLASAEQQLYELTTYGLDNQPQHHEIVSVHRLPSGLVSYQDSMSLPYTPIVPESYIYATQVKCDRSPEVGDVAPEISPYSPTITSTKAALPSPPETAAGGIKRTSSGAVKRRRADKKSQQDSLAAKGQTIVGGSNSAGLLTIDIPTTTTMPNSLGTPTGEIRCDECNKVFTKICYLTQHNKTFHNGEQPFRCNRCGKRFSNEAIFDTHYAKHSAVQKPHQCQFCPKQFHHKTDLRRHIDSHTGRKAYVCETCSKGFTRRDHLRKHGDTHKPKPPKPLKIRTAKQAS